MIVMLCVYIGALQKSGIVFCQKQFQAFVVGKLGQGCKICKCLLEYVFFLKIGKMNRIEKAEKTANWLPLLSEHAEVHRFSEVRI